jgi:hypothetical protein
MWAWMGIAALIAVGYYLYHKNQEASSSTVSDTGGSSGATDQSLVPQFVNQTYVENSPPSAPSTSTTTTPVKPPASKTQPVMHTWTAIASDSTMSQVAGRLGLFEAGKNTPDPSDMTPVNATAKNFIKNVYSKNPDAKIPKGAEFSYDLGTVKTT